MNFNFVHLVCQSDPDHVVFATDDGIYYSSGSVQSASIGLAEFLIVVILVTAILVPIVLIAAARMREFQSRSLAIAGSVLIMLPISLIAIPGLFVGIWSLGVLMREDVRKEFATRAVTVETTRNQIRQAGVWMIVSGVLAVSLIVTLAVFGFGQLNMVPPSKLQFPTIVMTIGGVLFGLMGLAVLQLVAGIKMKNRTSISWSYLAAILGLIPYSPAWLVSFPSSIYALAVLGQRTDGVKSNSELFDRRPNIKSV